MMVPKEIQRKNSVWCRSRENLKYLEKFDQAELADLGENSDFLLDDSPPGLSDLLDDLHADLSGNLLLDTPDFDILLGDALLLGDVLLLDNDILLDTLPLDGIRGFGDSLLHNLLDSSLGDNSGCDNLLHTLASGYTLLGDIHESGIPLPGGHPAGQAGGSGEGGHGAFRGPDAPDGADGVRHVQ